MPVVSPASSYDGGLSMTGPVNDGDQHSLAIGHSIGAATNVLMWTAGRIDGQLRPPSTSVRECKRVRLSG
jgi:hypothetical protein